MHPAFSVLFFTVTSGLGYGLMVMLILLQSFDDTTVFSTQALLLTGLTALILITAGLLSSTFHLANRKNVWRSLNRIRSSWLSREGFFALLYYPVALAYLYLLWHNDGQLNTSTFILGLFVVAISFIIVICTAMIYASLKTIPQWHNALTLPNFFIFSLMSGAVLLSALYTLFSVEASILLNMIGMSLLLIGLIGKLIWFKKIGKASGTTIQTATTFSQAQVRLLDPGHSADSFINKEFSYRVGPKTLNLARRLTLSLSFIIPLLLFVILLNGNGGEIVLWLAFICVYIGLLLERWLFFVEAKHVVRFYEIS